MTPLEFADFTLSAQDLVPLLPLLCLAAASVWVMLAIGIKRNYRFVLGSTRGVAC